MRGRNPKLTVRWRELAATAARHGAEEAMRRLAACGWCTLRPAGEEGSLVLKWSEGTNAVLEAMGDPGPGGALRLASLCLFLDLLGQYAEPAFAARLAQSEQGKVWAVRLLCQAARGRYRPSWWDLDPAWHEEIRAGEIRMPLLYANERQEGLREIVKRLAEFGWVDYKACVLNGSVKEAFRWREDLTPLLSLVLPPSGLDYADLDWTWQKRGVERLSLLLHLKVMSAPLGLQNEIAGGTEDSDAWCRALAVRAARGRYPLWWDRGAAWHKAVRERLVFGQGRGRTC